MNKKLLKTKKWYVRKHRYTGFYYVMNTNLHYPVINKDPLTYNEAISFKNILNKLTNC